jgi:hypothetical protein
MPKMLEDIFMVILPIAGELQTLFPNRNLVKGDKSLGIILVIVLLSAISIIPDQKHISGANVKNKLNAFSTPSVKSKMTASPPWVIPV